jgi:hypothetical protein
MAAAHSRFQLQPPPPELIRAAGEQWEVYAGVIREAQRDGVHFAAGGGLATSFYIDLWRVTKDMDLYVVPAAREELIEATRRAGMQDYYEQQPYDRNWIYRAVHEGIIVDVIWALANGYGEVDERWLRAGPEASVAGVRFALLAPEEILVTKLHVLQRDRCDWPDLLNLLYATGPVMDWERLLANFAGEEQLLAALMLLFSWLAPGRAVQCPDWLWERLQIPVPDARRPMRDQTRIDRLDTRPWFTPLRPPEAA